MRGFHHTTKQVVSYGRDENAVLNLALAQQHYEARIADLKKEGSKLRTDLEDIHVMLVSCEVERDKLKLRVGEVEPGLRMTTDVRYVQGLEHDLADALQLGGEAIEAMEWAYPDNHVYCDRKCIDTKHALIKAWHGRFDPTPKE